MFNSENILGLTMKQYKELLLEEYKKKEYYLPLNKGWTERNQMIFLTDNIYLDALIEQVKEMNKIWVNPEVYTKCNNKSIDIIATDMIGDSILRLTIKKEQSKPDYYNILSLDFSFVTRPKRRGNFKINDNSTVFEIIEELFKNV